MSTSTSASPTVNGKNPWSATILSYEGYGKNLFPKKITTRLPIPYKYNGPTVLDPGARITMAVTAPKRPGTYYLADDMRMQLKPQAAVLRARHDPRRRRTRHQAAPELHADRPRPGDLPGEARSHPDLHVGERHLGKDDRVLDQRRLFPAQSDRHAPSRPGRAVAAGQHVTGRSHLPHSPAALRCDLDALGPGRHYESLQAESGPDAIRIATRHDQHTAERDRGDSLPRQQRARQVCVPLPHPSARGCRDDDGRARDRRPVRPPDRAGNPARTAERRVRQERQGCVRSGGSKARRAPEEGSPPPPAS